MADDETAAPKIPRKRSVKSRARSGCATCKYEPCMSNATRRSRPAIVVCSSSTNARVMAMVLRAQASHRPVEVLKRHLGLPISRLQSRPKVHFDESHPSPAATIINNGKNLKPDVTTISNEFTAVVEHKKKQDLELRHQTMNSPMSPRLSLTSDEYIEKAFRFTVEIALPGLLLDHTSKNESPSCHTWIRLAAENPAALQVRLYSAEVYHRVLFKRPLNPAINLLATYAEAIKLLNEQLSDTATACSDGNLIAVGGLGFFGQSLPKLQSVDSLPNQGPLQDLQRLHVYSQMVYDPMHRRGLDLLIKVRGGLDKFKAHGIAAVTSFGDIVNSTENLLPPRHVFAAMLDVPSMSEIQRLGSRIGTQSYLRNLGSGFPADWQESIIIPLHELSTVLQSMAAYTIIVHNHIQENAVQDNKGKLADIRNFVQHHLLSLPASDKLTAIPDSLYEATRLAALIYSLLVVFPIHGPRAPFVELASQLRFNVSFLDLEKQMRLKHLLWIVVMGAISGMNTPNRIWFVWAVRELSLRLKINAWEEVKDILGQFLWFENTNNRDGRKVWEEVEGAGSTIKISM
ncbi:hypothetical protein N431DRAFT_476667 [Stipitochalara longipes BDJ]|nr:hypothetical protein N431DRAFT_476667 [Stipitochalara longipes BDJ]